MKKTLLNFSFVLGVILAIETSSLLAAVISSTDSFGNAGTSNSVPGWTDSDGIGQDARVEQSSSRAGSATDEHARMREGAHITKTVSTVGYSNIVLKYYWRGDDQAESSDKLLVQWKNAASSTYTTLSTLALDNDDWSSQVSVSLPAAANNTSINIRFQANTTSSSEEARVDDVSLEGTVLNTLPVAANKTVTTDEDMAAVVTMTATDADIPANTLTYGVVANPTHGSLSLLNSGTGEITYTPALNYNGSDSYTYKVYDGIGYSNTATVSITVNAINDAPTLSGVLAEYTTPELVAFTFTATGNDVEGSSLSYSLSGTVPTGASINPTTGVFTWTTTEAQGPADYTFDVVVSDGSLSTTKSITVHVSEVNLAPVLATIGNKTGTEDATTTFTISGSDVDVPTQTLSYSASGLPAGAIFDTLTNTFTWVPAFDQSGTHNVTFTVTDGLLSDSEIVPITIGNVNRPPVLATIGDKTVDEGATSTFTISATDADANELSYSATELPTGATFDTETKTFTWSPTFDQSGSYNVTFTVTDGTDTDTETVVITVNNMNRAPVSLDQATTTDEDVSISLLLSATDVDMPAQTLTYSMGNPAHGTLSGVSTSTGAATYTPNSNYNGTDSFTFTATDGSTVSNVATVSITINSINDTPIIVLNGSSTVDLTKDSEYIEDGAVCTDAEAEGELKYSISGEVNMSVVGEYVLTYTCYDSSETSVNVARTVNVVAPSITPIVPSFSGGGSPAPAPVAPVATAAPQGEVLGASTSCGVYSDKFLRKGYKNDEASVQKLQKFLNDYMKSDIKESGVFDTATESALKKFQIKHSDNILKPWKISVPTGILYLTTRTEINNIMCPDLKLSVPTNLVPMSKSDIN
jgi:VCBS repeat-containing protein